MCWNLGKSSDEVTFEFEFGFLAQIAYRSRGVDMIWKNAKICDEVCCIYGYQGQFRHFWASMETLLSQFGSFLNAYSPKVSSRIWRVLNQHSKFKTLFLRKVLFIHAHSNSIKGLNLPSLLPLNASLTSKGKSQCCQEYSMKRGIVTKSW